MINKKKALISLFEISILILSGAAYSYFADETSWYFADKYGEEKFIGKIRDVVLGYLSEGLVSAQEGLWTCVRDLNGAICQEYPAETCSENCDGDCLPGRRNDFQQCTIGTCLDSEEGTCSAGTPKLACQESGGEWFAQEPPQCKPGCCLIGGNANYITEQACGILQDRQGIEGEWREVENEIQCLLLENEQEEGACVLGEIPDNPGLHDCRFTTQAECLSIGGGFNSGALCSNSELNTVCERQETTSCIPGKDEVYWIDSCGNRENIYDANKARSWNNGLILPKGDSCELDEDNQASCGNCNYISGSICGLPGEEDARPLEGDFVCKDLSCVDEWGAERRHGESWCAFDSQIGVDGEGNKGRSVDVPGSGHYRKLCIDGEVRTEACADYRNEVCQENRDEEIGFSSASCRINNWQTCISSNTDKEKLDACETNTDCSLKKVRLGGFKFDVCTPKYPPGFDLRADYGGEVGESICSAGSQTCTVVEQKGFGGWKCIQNCPCKTAQFAETMNNLCISLGDCGANVNIEGEFTSSGYSVKRAPKLGQGYISGLRDYAEAERGQMVDPLTEEEIAAIFGLQTDDPEFDSKLADIIGGLGAGAAGAVLISGIIAYGPALAFELISQYGIAGLGSVFAEGGALLGPWSGALAAAGAAGAIGFFLGQMFGLEGDALLGVTIGGAVTGVFLHFGVEGLSFFVNFGAWLFWTIFIIIILILIFKAFGIGDTRKIKVAFTCSPWQPPLGGDSCEICNDDPLGCSKYKCQSLGQTCEFVNEGTGEEMCVNNNPNDVLPPIIKPNEDVISDGFEYQDVTDRSFGIASTITEDGCIPAYTQVTWGVSLNEVGQCKYDTIHTSDYDDMEFFFGESSLFKKSHVTAFSLPSLESLGESGFDPDRRADLDLYMRCQDANGNKNTEEFAVSFCVSPEDDLTAPILRNFDPESPAYVSLEAESLNMSFYTNEPADCKWDASDVSYESMSNNIGCNIELEDMTLFGFACNAVLPVTAQENEYYFRCLDQPLAEEGRNANSQSVKYEAIRTSEPLIIENILITPKPDNNGIIYAGTEPVSVSLDVKTSGGAPVARWCEFDLGGGLIRFFESSGDLHRQTFSSLFENEYSIDIRCEDDAGNVALDVAEFSIEVDDSGPRITRLYSDGRLLKVVTDEEAVCRYSHNSCGFTFSDGSEMAGRELVHTADFDRGLNYYIKCQDNFGNTGSCSTVRAGY